MCKVKYHDTIEPQNYDIEFPTEQEAMEWISEEMNEWWDIICTNYPNTDACWLNRYLDCGDTTEIYIPATSVVISCTFCD